jgi:hypothetical protein
MPTAAAPVAASANVSAKDVKARMRIGKPTLSLCLGARRVKARCCKGFGRSVEAGWLRL